MQPTYARRTHAKDTGDKDLRQASSPLPGPFICGNLGIRPLKQLPHNSVQRRNAILLDVECGGFTLFRGAQVHEIPGRRVVIAVVADRATIIPPDYLPQCLLEKGIWEIAPLANGKVARYGN